MEPYGSLYLAQDVREPVAGMDMGVEEDAPQEPSLRSWDSIGRELGITGKQAWSVGNRALRKLKTRMEDW